MVLGNTIRFLTQCAEAQRLLSAFEALRPSVGGCSAAGASRPSKAAPAHTIVDFSSTNLRDDQVCPQHQAYARATLVLLVIMIMARTCMFVILEIQVQYLSSQLAPRTTTCDFSCNVLSAAGAASLCNMLQVAALVLYFTRILFK